METVRSSSCIIPKINSRTYINVVRGFAIFLMLWGHCIQYCSIGTFDFFENIVFKGIYSFHMPLLMMISGFLYFYSAEKRSLSELLIHRTQALLQPIIMCGVLYFLLVEVLRGVLASGSFSVLISGGWLSHLNQYWFLWAVLAASVVVGISAKITDCIVVQFLLMVVGVSIIAMFPNARVNLYVYPYFLLGYFYARYKDSIWMRKLYHLRYVSLIVFPIMMLFYKKDHYIYTTGFFGENGLWRHMPVNLFRWLIGLMGCIFVLTTFEMIMSRLCHKEKLPLIMRGFEDLGKKSLQVYVLSCIFLSEYLPIAYMMLVKIIGSNIFAENMWVYTCIFTLCIAVGYSVFLPLLTKLLERTKISKVLFGK